MLIILSHTEKKKNWLIKLYSGLQYRLFGFVARKQGSTTDNVTHLFAELEPDQPASTIVHFVSKAMLNIQKPWVTTWQPSWFLHESEFSHQRGFGYTYLIFPEWIILFTYIITFFLLNNSGGWAFTLSSLWRFENDAGFLSEDLTEKKQIKNMSGLKYCSKCKWQG